MKHLREIIEPVHIAAQTRSGFRFAALGLALAYAGSLTLGCRAQVPGAPAGQTERAVQGTLPAELSRRVEILIRSKLNVPPNYEVQIGGRQKSEIPNYDLIQVVFVEDGKFSRPAIFLLSADGNTLAQFNKFDVSADPKALVSDSGRPARGGPENAPVVIVGFDDLECPFCAKMNAQLFPALLDRYKDQVRIVYRDFPISQHPWAMRAAVDANCLAAQSPTGYWSLVDYIHAHAAELGGADKNLAKANEELDKLTNEQGKRDKVSEDKLQACIKKQDTTAIDASLKLGETLGVEATPVLFINGEKLEGAYPLEDVYRMIDGALIAAGKTPPPPAPAAPAAPVPASSTGPAATPAKPGS